MHNDGIAQTEEFFPRVWSCLRCRLVPAQVQGLTSSAKLQKQHASTVGLLKVKDEAYQRLPTENQQLRQRVADVSSAFNEETWRQPPGPHDTAFFGSSVIRDIDQTKLVAIECAYFRGGHVKDIKAAVDKFPATTNFVVLSLLLVVTTVTVVWTGPLPTSWANTETSLNERRP